MKKSLVLLGVLAFSQSSQVFGEALNNRFYGRPYDAVSEITMSDGSKVTSRDICDGNGKVRMDKTGAAGQGRYTILDCNTKEVATVMSGAKTVMRGRAPEKLIKPDQDVDKTDIKDLGTQVIGGHPCTGESFKIKDASYEVWKGTDINYPVRTICTTARGKTESNLKAFGTNPPPPSIFQIPAGYKTVSVGSQGAVR